MLPGGPHEVEESAFTWRNCTKNPGHPRFIPAPELSITDFPEHYRTSWVLDCVKYVAVRTVKLRVGFVSPARPDGYAFSTFRGTCVPHFGTGRVSGIRSGSGSCPCHECFQSQSPCQTWYKVEVHTALHVVYNTEEAKATQVDFFYDDEHSDKDGRMRTIRGSDALSVSPYGDFCVLTCVTHDMSIAQELELSDAHFSGYGAVNRTLNTNLKQLCVIVSHPHGQPKKVTVGVERRRDRVPYDYDRSRFHHVYTTDTCPGSSGAFIIMVDADLSVYLPSSTMFWGAVHSTGGLEGGLNRSGMRLIHKSRLH